MRVLMGTEGRRVPSELGPSQLLQRLSLSGLAGREVLQRVAMNDT